MVAQINSDYIRTRPTRLWPRLISYLFFEGRPLTTRARWMNRIVFALFAFEKRLPLKKTVREPTFILGTGRSGTTVLGIVLSMHREIGFLNEPKALWHALHDDEDLIGSYTRAPARYRFCAKDVDNGLRRAAHRLFGAYLCVSGTERVVDKYPELIFRVPFVKAIFPDARFLFLSRSGQDTCGSIHNWSERLGAEVGQEIHDWWGANDRKWNLLVEQLVPEHPDLAAHTEKMNNLDHEGRAAVEWIVTMREGLDLAAHDPDAILHVPYEMLCENAVGWAMKLETFLNLTSDKVFEQYAIKTLRNPMREATLSLPQWLRPIFNETENRRIKAAAVSASNERLRAKKN